MLGNRRGESQRESVVGAEVFFLLFFFFFGQGLSNSSFLFLFQGFENFTSKGF
jgi:hypothetical protein